MLKRLGCFVAGGAIGAAIALLFAPRPGDETRAIVTDWANDACNNASGLATYFQDASQVIAHDAQYVGQAAAKAATSYAQTIPGNVQAAAAGAPAAAQAAAENAKAAVAGAPAAAQAAAENAKAAVAGAPAAAQAAAANAKAAVAGAPAAAQAAAANVQAKAAGVVESVKSAKAPAVVAERSDEVRAKIEEARNRIAAQVAQNAASTKAAIDGVIPAETEAPAEEAAEEEAPVEAVAEVAEVAEEAPVEAEAVAEAPAEAEAPAADAPAEEE